MFFTSALLLSVPVFALASPQYGYGGGDSSSSSSAAPASSAPASSATTAASAAAPSAPADTSGHFNIDVAFSKTLTFHPANITASNGSTVTFFFPDALHSVTQSSFAAPCTYLAATSSTEGGFDSGLTSAKQFTVNIVDDTKPIWFHCKMANHCGQGMVGSINAPATGNTYDAFKAAALKIGGSQTPETATGVVTGGVNGKATAAPAATAASASPSKNSALRFKVGAGAGLFAVALALGSA